MGREARWDRTGDELRHDVERARDTSVVALTASGEGESLRYAIIVRAGAPQRQRVELDVEADLAASVVARNRREGFAPVALAMSGAGRTLRLALVLEEIDDPAHAADLVAPCPFAAMSSGEGFVARAAARAGAVTSVAVGGRLTDSSGAGLVVAALVAPRRDARIGWAVYLDPIGVGGALGGDEAKLLARAASPVTAFSLSTPAEARFSFSLWHDVVATSWPPGEPVPRVGPSLSATTSSAVKTSRLCSNDGGTSDDVCSRSPRATPGRAPASSRSTGRATPAARFPRTFHAMGPATTSSTAPPHPLDLWAHERMRESGARHGQLVVVRGRRLAYAKAFTFAEDGYPVATLDDALRLGSVSKAFTAIALYRALRLRGLPLGVDTPVSDPSLLGPGACSSPSLARLTLRHLLAHDAGLHASNDISPDDPSHPLAEHDLARRLTGARRPLDAGDLSRALVASPADAFFARPPGGAAKDLVYSNEGFILLGELVSRLVTGRLDAYADAVTELLLAPSGVDPGTRGVLLAAGYERARARGESPAHPSSPRWTSNRFGGDEASPFELTPYADNGPFLGGAAGWCVPLLWIARVLAELGPHPAGGLWTRADADIALAPAAPKSTIGHGVHLSDGGWWTVRAAREAPRSVRVERLHHNGRVRGGSALFLYAIPRDPLDEDARLGVVAAFNQLGDLYDEPHGRALLAILRKLEADRDFVSRDLFSDG